jgi:hypothetical protein
MVAFPRMTLAEMEEAFPDEWVLIIDPDETDSGAVAAHSASRPDVDTECDRLKPRSAAIYFMPGPRSLAEPKAFLL